MNDERRRLLKAAASKARSGASERDEQIRLANAEGASLREIAAVVGMTHAGVRRVIQRG